MKNLMVDWLANYEQLQEMPLELSAEIDALLETVPTNKDIEETREFLADRYNILQELIEKMRGAILSGSAVVQVEHGCCVGKSI